MKLKLDLHVHLFEAVNFARPEAKLIYKLVNVLKEKGLDGIAISDHGRGGLTFAYQVKELTGQIFGDDFVIIPGQEIRCGLEHIVELYLANYCTFRFIAHPTNCIEGKWRDLGAIHAIEIENGNYSIDREGILDLARRRGILALKNSDAHCMSEIGKLYNEIDLQELYIFNGR